MSRTPDLLLKDFKPQSRLSARKTQIDRPCFPVIDAHNHLGNSFGPGWVDQPVGALLDVMDAAGVDLIIDLDGGWGEEILERHLDHFKAAAPERFKHYGGVDWEKWPEYGDSFGEWVAARLRTQAARGAEGLKIWKVLGLKVQDHTGKRVQVDDERLVPLWATAAELDIPVLIHVADPVAFFDPLDRRNERWEELNAHPDWHFPAPPYPAFLEIMAQFANMVKANPDTTFIGAHVGCYAENLAWVSELLDAAPNFYVDISARMAELGRQPYTAREFCLRHADRVVFGTDLTADPAMYRLHYRFLETDDEYFDYSVEEIPPQGRWQIYGLHLPEDVLEKIYALNAKRIYRKG